MKPEVKKEKVQKPVQQKQEAPPAFDLLDFGGSGQQATTTPAQAQEEDGEWGSWADFDGGSGGSTTTAQINQVQQ